MNVSKKEANDWPITEGHMLVEEAIGSDVRRQMPTPILTASKAKKK